MGFLAFSDDLYFLCLFEVDADVVAVLHLDDYVISIGILGSWEERAFEGFAGLGCDSDYAPNLCLSVLEPVEDFSVISFEF